jgi:hypothetical protein
MSSHGKESTNEEGVNIDEMQTKIDMGKLITRVDKEWNEIEPEVYQNLIESMPRRVEAVIQAKGGYTKY